MKKPNAYLLLIVALAQWTAPLLPLFGVGETIGAQATGRGIAPELPPGIFFSIWSVIFTLYLGFALMALLKPGYLEGEIGVPILIAGVGNVAWMLAAQSLGNQWLNFLLLLPILLFSWEASHRLHRMGGWDGTGRRLIACALAGLLSGWLTVAVSISVPGLVRALCGMAPTDAVWISLWSALIPAGLLTWLYANRVSAGLWFFVALGWGLAGIAVNNWVRLGTHWLAIMTVIVGLYVLWRRLAHGARPAFS